MPAMDVIETVQAEWASFTVLVPKNNRILRNFIHYCKLNVETIQDLYPIPCMDEHGQMNQLACRYNDIFDIGR